jgi:hypothetical protein
MKTLKRHIGLVALILLAFFFLPGTVIAQTDPQTSEAFDDGIEGVIVVNVWASSTSPLADSSDVQGPPLSKGFLAASLRTMTAFRQWQGHLSHTIRNGYPLAEHWIAAHRERAADRLILASLAASTDADRAALNELAKQFENLRRWSDSMVQANRKLDMAKFYMSPATMENDELFQKAAGCANFLAPMLASGHLREDSSCH